MPGKKLLEKVKFDAKTEYRHAFGGKSLDRGSHILRKFFEKVVAPTLCVAEKYPGPGSKHRVINMPG